MTTPPRQPSPDPRLFVRIGGMHCAHCEAVLRHALEAVDGVETVGFRGHVAEVRPAVDPS